MKLIENEKIRNEQDKLQQLMGESEISKQELDAQINALTQEKNVSKTEYDKLHKHMLSLTQKLEDSNNANEGLTNQVNKLNAEIEMKVVVQKENEKIKIESRDCKFKQYI